MSEIDCIYPIAVIAAEGGLTKVCLEGVAISPLKTKSMTSHEHADEKAN